MPFKPLCPVLSAALSETAVFFQFNIPVHMPCVLQAALEGQTLFCLYLACHELIVTIIMRLYVTTQDNTAP